jgi:ABC-type phosphate transport system permease subunit
MIINFNRHMSKFDIFVTNTRWQVSGHSSYGTACGVIGTFVVAAVTLLYAAQ